MPYLGYFHAVERNPSEIIVPRETFTPKVKLEKLSILTHDGKLDTVLEPKLPDSEHRKIYLGLLQCRLFDERMLALQRQGRIGTYGPSKGEEAVALGAAYWLKKDDWFVPSYRETAAFFWRGWTMDKIMLWWGGNEVGSQVPDGVNDLPICVPISTQCQHAMGIAWGGKMRKDGTVCVCCIGDGGTSEGDFHESLNYAGLYKMPLVMVVRNNQWAISIPRKAQTGSETIFQKAVAYGMDGIEVDGNDILSMIVAMKEAIEKARAGGGPTLIEAVTYRLAMHTTADDPKKYRSEDEVKAWEKKDPLLRYADYLRKKGVLNETIEKEMQTQVNEAFDKALKIYEAYQLDRYAFFNYAYENMTPELERQLAELKEYDEWVKTKSGGGVPAAAH